MPEWLKELIDYTLRACGIVFIIILIAVICIGSGAMIQDGIEQKVADELVNNQTFLDKLREDNRL